MPDTEAEEIKKRVKENWPNMTFGQKIGYFKDYYLKQIIAAIIVIAVVIALIVRIATPAKEYAVNILFIDTTLDDETREALEQEAADALNVSTDDISIRDTFLSNDPNAMMSLDALLSNGEVDIMICGSEFLRNYAADGYFADLEDLKEGNPYDKKTDENEGDDVDTSALSEYYIYTPGYQEDDDPSDENKSSDDSNISAESETVNKSESSESVEGENRAYGIDISCTADWKSWSENSSIDGASAAILANSSHKANAVRFLEAVLGRHS